ncbi:hypothetical protein EJB05_47761 [Eragrostis curvula]|uniref:Uncharacterized protein n=1 Tax=Eragrostis curvula TaxID=38414 RepID=A0A5J9T024_9POAL|nr:hypothetical protein EJB05_47761 [Eragrostis curvula]
MGKRSGMLVPRRCSGYRRLRDESCNQAHRAGEKRWKGQKKRENKLKHLDLHLQELHTANCWLIPVCACAILPVWWHGINIEKSALSTSSEASLLSKHITYSITAVSQGSVILPSLVNPSSSCNSFRSSSKTAVRRYSRGISNRFPSEESCTQQIAGYVHRVAALFCFVILSPLVNPNSSRDIFSSSSKTVVWRRVCILVSAKAKLMSLSEIMMLCD